MLHYMNMFAGLFMASVAVHSSDNGHQHTQEFDAVNVVVC
jgi:hypothetical protein